MPKRVKSWQQFNNNNNNMFIFQSNKQHIQKVTTKLKACTLPHLQCSYNSLEWNVLYFVKLFSFHVGVQQLSHVTHRAIFKPFSSWDHMSKIRLLLLCFSNFFIHFKSFLVLRIFYWFECKFLAEVDSSCL